MASLHYSINGSTLLVRCLLRFNRDKFHGGLTVTREDNLFAAFRAADKIGELGPGVADRDFHRKIVVQMMVRVNDNEKAGARAGPFDQCGGIGRISDPAP